MSIGNQAYELVCAYSGMGFHRTGSEGDAITVHWLAGELAEHGAEVSVEPFRYRHFDADVTVESDGRVLDAMALYYSFTGQHELLRWTAGFIDGHVDEEVISSHVAMMVAGAKAGKCDGLVLAALSPTGALCAINRDHESEPDLPVIVVGEQDFEVVQTRGATIRCSAAIRDGEAANVVARFAGPPGAGSLVITTPISGWFNCAGERGTGLAIALIVAKQLSSRISVDLLLASGHELGFAGGYHLAENFDVSSTAVLHLGSCIANLDSEMMSVCAADPVVTDRITTSLAPLGVKPVVPADPSDPDNWVGESKCWTAHDRPMLSIAGQSRHFHTPDDLPEVATTPQLLELAIEAIGDAALALAGAQR